MNVWLTNLPFFSAKELACQCCGDREAKD